jgi:hypothetical protein
MWWVNLVSTKDRCPPGKRRKRKKGLRIVHLVLKDRKPVRPVLRAIAHKDLVLKVRRIVRPAHKDLVRKVRRIVCPAHKDLVLKVRRIVRPVHKDLVRKVRRIVCPAHKDLVLKVRRIVRPAHKDLVRKARRIVRPAHKDLVRKARRIVGPAHKDLVRKVRRIVGPVHRAIVPHGNSPTRLRATDRLVKTETIIPLLVKIRVTQTPPKHHAGCPAFVLFGISCLFPVLLVGEEIIFQRHLGLWGFISAVTPNRRYLCTS